MCSDAEKYHDLKDLGDMFKVTSNLKNKQISCNCYIRDVYGVILNDAEKICKRLVEYCEQVFAKDLSMQAADNIQNIEEDEPDITMS